MPTDTSLKYDDLISEKVKLFPDYVEEYINYMYTHNHSLLTIYNYLSDYELFFNWLISESFHTGTKKDIPLKVLEKLRILHIDNYIASLRRNYIKKDKKPSEKMSNKTIDRRIASLKSLFYYLSQIAEDDDLYPLLKRNVMAKYSMKAKKATVAARAHNIESVILKDKEFAEFRQFVAYDYGEKISAKRTLNLYHYNRERDTAIISLVLGSGLRVSELVGMDTDDIDWVEQKIYVRRKGDKVDSVSFSDISRADLEEYFKVRAIRYKRYLADDNEKAVFLSYPIGRYSQSKRMTHNSIQKMVKKYAAAFGKPQLSIHKLRHSFATNMQKETNNIHHVKEQLGHEDLNTTMIYLHVNSKDLKESVNKADS